MITEDYVSYEVAKLLKEKGFNIICDKVYRENDSSYLCPIEYCMNLKGEGYYLAPTLQMAMKWLREVHGIAIETMLLSNGWFCQIERILEGFCKEYIDETDSYKTYEKAVESAIKYCLENLLTFKIKEES